ncbi:MAG TPA: hypothetical protein DEO60_13365 [Bacteroidales bacterium]|nr:hypothetical protein [Bacteroidales bacterium]
MLKSIFFFFKSTKDGGNNKVTEMINCFIVKHFPFLLFVIHPPSWGCLKSRNPLILPDGR